MTTNEIYLKFKSFCPNSREPFNPTETNVIRWQWQIRELEQAKQTLGVPQKPIFRRKSWPRKFERRRVKSFEEMPPYMREQYGEIASHFPGVQVWACGSRVAGDYIEPWDGDDIRQLRAKTFKPNKTQSDFDFWIEGEPTPVDGLPVWADQLRGLLPETERIKIAMWDFSKLPESEFETVIFAVQSNDVRTLVEIHNKYELSPYNYCCDLSGLIRWFNWAIESGTIVASKTTIIVGDGKTADHQLD